MSELDAIKARAAVVAGKPDNREPTEKEFDALIDGAVHDVPTLVAALEAVLELHSKWQIHDCECEYHTAEYECDSEVMYTVCRECCTSNGYHTEECASEHIHGPTHPICPTVAAIHQALGEGEK